MKPSWTLTGRKSRRWAGITTWRTRSIVPFQAKCIVSKVVSPLRKGETVEVRRLAPEDACASDVLVLIRRQGRNMAVPLSQLAAIDPDESTDEAIGDWHYWVAQGYLF